MATWHSAIGARDYTLACEPGQEAHLALLAKIVDQKLALAGMRGQTEARTLLYGALFLADEISALTRQNQQAAQVHDAPAQDDVEDGGALLADAADEAPDGAALSADFPDRLDAIALRLENLASRLSCAR